MRDIIKVCDAVITALIKKANLNQIFRFFAVFDGITPPESSKSQTPEKFQGPNFNAPSWMATTSLGPWFGA